ncbi:MAG: pilus assembly protein PilM [bacterium]
MLNRIVAIEFNDRRIKICKLTHGARNIEVSLFITCEIEAGQGSQGSAEEDVVSALKKCSETYNIITDQVIVGLPTRSAMLRNIHFPFTDLNKINKVYAYEVEDSLPRSLHEVLSDFYVIQSERAKGVELLVALILEKDIERDFQILVEAGLGPQVITLATMGLANLYSQTLGKQSSGPDMVIDIGRSHSLVVVMEKSKVLFTREISVAGEDITNSIQHNCHVGYQEAEEMKCQYAIKLGIHNNDAPPPDNSEHADDTASADNAYYTEEGDDLDAPALPDIENNENSQLDQSILQSLSHLGDHINLTIASFNETCHRPVSRVLITGGTSQMPGIEGYLEDKLGLRVELFRPFQNLKMRFGIREYADQEALMAVPFGLCLKGSRSYKKIGRMWNFSRGKYIYHKKYTIAGKKVVTLSVFIFLILLLAGFQLGLKYNNSKNKLESYESLKDTIVREAFPGETIPKDQISFMQERLMEEENKLKMFKHFLGYQPSSLDVLREISERISDQYKVRIEDFQFDSDKINLKGYIESFDMLDKMKAALNESPYFASVKVEEAKIKRRGNDINFNLEIRIKESEIKIN